MIGLKNLLDAEKEKSDKYFEEAKKRNYEK